MTSDRLVIIIVGYAGAVLAETAAQVHRGIVEVPIVFESLGSRQNDV